MPRGVRKPVDYDAELLEIDSKLAVLKKKREEILDKKTKADMDSLMTFMKENQMSASEVLGVLSNAVAASSNLKAVKA